MTKHKGWKICGNADAVFEFLEDMGKRGIVAEAPGFDMFQRPIIVWLTEFDDNAVLVEAVELMWSESAEQPRIEEIAVDQLAYPVTLLPKESL